MDEIDTLFYPGGIQSLSATEEVILTGAATTASGRTLAAWVTQAGSTYTLKAALYNGEGSAMGTAEIVSYTDRVIGGLAVSSAIPYDDKTPVSKEAMVVVFNTKVNGGASTVLLTVASTAHPSTGNDITLFNSTPFTVASGMVGGPLAAVAQSSGGIYVAYTGQDEKDNLSWEPSVTVSKVEYDSSTHALALVSTNGGKVYYNPGGESEDILDMKMVTGVTGEGREALALAWYTDTTFDAEPSHTKSSHTRMLVVDTSALGTGDYYVAAPMPPGAKGVWWDDNVWDPFPSENKVAGVALAGYTWSDASTTTTSFAVATVASGEEVLLRSYHRPESTGSYLPSTSPVSVYALPDGTASTLASTVALSTCHSLVVSYVLNKTVDNQNEVKSQAMDYGGSTLNGRSFSTGIGSPSTSFSNLRSTLFSTGPTYNPDVAPTFFVIWEETKGGGRQLRGRAFQRVFAGKGGDPDPNAFNPGACFGSDTLWVFSNETATSVYGAVFSPAVEKATGGIARATYFDPHKAAGVTTPNDRDYLILAATTGHPEVVSNDFQVAKTGEGTFNIDPLALVANSGNAQTTSVVLYWDDETCGEVQAGIKGPARGGNEGLHVTPGKVGAKGNEARVIKVVPLKPISQPSPLWSYLVLVGTCLLLVVSLAVFIHTLTLWWRSPGRRWEADRVKSYSIERELARNKALEARL